MTANDENLIPSLQALSKDTSDDRTVEQELAEFHATYAKLEDDPASLTQLDVLFADAAFDLRGTNVTTDRDGSDSATTPPHSPMVRWIARPDHRLVVALAPHPQALERMLDVLPLVEADYRVQVVFTAPTTRFQWAGMEDSVRDLGGLWVPWEQAQRIRFDLILATSHWGIRDLSGPVMLMSHRDGAVRSRVAPWDAQARHHLAPEALMLDGDVLPAALALVHEEELGALAESCPQALSRAMVAGDPSFDRMVASLPCRQVYREALGVPTGQRLVVVSSTWAVDSLFGKDPAIFDRLMAELPAEDYRVICVLHPFVWSSHGRRQVLAWLSEARAAGLNIVPPHGDWRAALISADLVVGDHGSVTQYAAGLNVPVLVDTSDLAVTRPGSAAASLAQLAPSLQPDRPLLPQIERAINEHVPQRYAPIIDLITSRPGQAGSDLRHTAYHLLNLPEPGFAVRVSPVPLPKVIPPPATVMQKRRKTSPVALDDDVLLAHADPNSDKEILATLGRIDHEQLITELPRLLTERQRQVILAVDVEGLTRESAAKQLGISVRSLRNLRNTALARLRRHPTTPAAPTSRASRTNREVPR